MGKIKYDYDLILKQFQSGKTASDLGKIYSTNPRIMRKILGKMGIKFPSIRKHFFNQDYFEKVDTPEKAYWLGFIYADGCNTGRGLTITLQERDSYILSKLAKIVDYRGKLYTYRSKESPYNLYTTLALYSNKVSDDLTKIGVVRKKTHVVEFPLESILPNHLYSHFIRGVFDGDGCISRGSGQNSIFIVGNRIFMQGIMDVLIKECGLNKTKLLHKKGYAENIVYLVYTGNIQTRKVADWMYKDCEDLFLTRKKEKFYGNNN